MEQKILGFRLIKIDVLFFSLVFYGPPSTISLVYHLIFLLKLRYSLSDSSNWLICSTKRLMFHLQVDTKR